MVSKVFWVKLISDTGWKVGEDFLEIYFLVCQFFRKKCAAEREKNSNRFWVGFVRLHLVTITNCSNLSVRPTNENPILVEIMNSIKKPAGHSVYTSNPGTSEYLYMFLIQVPQRGKVVFHEEYSLRVVVFQTSRRIRRHGLQRSGFDARICWILGGIRGPGSVPLQDGPVQSEPNWR